MSFPIWFLTSYFSPLAADEEKEEVLVAQLRLAKVLVPQTVSQKQRSTLNHWWL